MSLKALQRSLSKAHQPVPDEIKTLARQLWHIGLTSTALGFSLEELAHIAMEENAGPYRAD